MQITMSVRNTEQSVRLSNEAEKKFNNLFNLCEHLVHIPVGICIPYFLAYRMESWKHSLKRLYSLEHGLLVWPQRSSSAAQVRRCICKQQKLQVSPHDITA